MEFLVITTVSIICVTILICMAMLIAYSVYRSNKDWSAIMTILKEALVYFERMMREFE